MRWTKGRTAHGCRDSLEIDLDLVDGGTQRTNLQFGVIRTTQSQKLAHLHETLESYLPSDLEGGAIIYCATRNNAEKVAEFLNSKRTRADYFHAGLTPERKKQVQDDFIQGRLRAISAANAFGMGIDKPDVRLVIHADKPGSLENYLQEAGRAGRDNDAAHCLLLYTNEDIDRQYGMTSLSRLTQPEINAVLRSLRNLDRKKRTNGEVIATPGEILLQDDEHEFLRDTATDDTRVRTAISWLEEATILSRHENEVNIFPASLQVQSMEQARQRIYSLADLDTSYKQQLLQIVRRLINANSDEGITTDELSVITGLPSEGIRKAMTDLAGLGLVSNDAKRSLILDSARLGIRVDPPPAVAAVTQTLAAQPATAPVNVQSTPGGMLQADANVLVLADTSGSMDGEKIEQLKSSILEFVGRVDDPGEYIGLIDFDDDIEEVIPLGPFGVSLDPWNHAVEQLDGAGGTAFFDAVSHAINVLEMQGAPGQYHHLVDRWG